ncbi:MAG: ubiquitin-like protein, partial [Octadecabacter sp.]
PDPNGAGILIYGGDAMRVALKRQDVIKTLVGPNGEEEMRLTRMSGADLRKDPALLGDAIKAQGFFPGPRVVFVEEVTEVAAKAIIRHQMNIPTKHQRLFFGDIELEDGRALAHYNVESETTLCVVLRDPKTDPKTDPQKTRSTPTGKYSYTYPIIFLHLPENIST